MTPKHTDLIAAHGTSAPWDPDGNAQADIEDQRAMTASEAQTQGDELRFDDFDEALKARQSAWVAEGEGDTLPVEFYAIELVGELGELFNVIKKLMRERFGIRGSRATQQDMESEFGDLFITIKNMAAKYGVDLESVAREKFNATSEKYGFPHRVVVARLFEGEVSRAPEAVAVCAHCNGTGQPNGIMGGPEHGLCSYCGGSGLSAPAHPLPQGEAETELNKLIEYFRGGGYGKFGWNGDVNGWSPAETAIDAMRGLPPTRPLGEADDTDELVAELTAMLDHDAALGLKPPLHDKIRALLASLTSLRAERDEELARNDILIEETARQFNRAEAAESSLAEAEQRVVELTAELDEARELHAALVESTDDEHAKQEWTIATHLASLAAEKQRVVELDHECTASMQTIADERKRADKYESLYKQAKNNAVFGDLDSGETYAQQMVRLESAEASNREMEEALALASGVLNDLTTNGLIVTDIQDARYGTYFVEIGIFDTIRAALADQPGAQTEGAK